MSDFLRPEARATLMRWREVIAGGVVAAAGIWLVATRFGFLSWVGWGSIALGLAMAYAGWQHARFRTGDGGPGVVEITERRITYLGPLTGGMADLDLLAELEFDPTGHPGHWRLTATSGAVLAIPVNAAGAEALHDVFAALPGIRTENMLRALASPPPSPVTLWSATPPRLT